METIKVKVTIEETCSETFVIDVPAGSDDPIEEAMEITRDKYWKSEIVLDPGNCIRTQMCAEYESDVTEWVEL